MEGRGGDGTGLGKAMGSMLKQRAGGRLKENAITTSSEMLQLISFVNVSVGRGGLRGVM